MLLMSRLASVAIAVASIAVPTGTSFAGDLPGGQKENVLETTIAKKVKLRYLLFLPQGYEQKGEKRWPLILFLHGAGERGDDLSLVARHGPPKVVGTRPDFPFIVVSPQLPADRGQWPADELLALLDEVEAAHAVDKDRVYLTGLSMGGYGTWSLGLAHPERFAAIAPFCGGGSLIGVILPDAAKAKALKTLPIWVFHGARDHVVPLDESQRLVDRLQRMENHVKFTVLPEADHDCWTEPYGGKEIYDWFLEHKLSARKLD